MSERDKVIDALKNEFAYFKSEEGDWILEDLATFTLAYHAKQNAEKLAKLEAFVNRLMQFEMSGEREIFGRIAWQKDAAHNQPSFKVGERLADGSYDVVWAKTPLEAIYTYLEQAEGGEE